MTLDELDAELDVALDDRVAAHRERAARTIGVPEYLARLRAVCVIEDRIEPQRRALGATHGRAYERCVMRGEIVDGRLVKVVAPYLLSKPVQLALELSA